MLETEIEILMLIQHVKLHYVLYNYILLHLFLETSST